LAESLLKINNIDVFHGTFQILWDVSLSVNAGERVCLLGANASGKSSLLETISGLLHPTRGSIEFDGKDITHLSPSQVVELGISQIPEGGQVFQGMTVLQNLIIGSYNRRARAKKGEMLKMVYELLPMLKERKNQLAGTLSGGEQQMLAIGRGLMSSPKLLLLDEIFLGVAPILINNLYNVLNAIHKIGVTILFIEENVKRSLENVDRAYVLKTGRVVMSGDSAELQQNQAIIKTYFGT
jgi:branched-chain amino acid transport system ATP-binding protein